MAKERQANLRDKSYQDKARRYKLSQEQREAERLVRQAKRQVEYEQRQLLRDQNRQYYYHQSILDTVVGSMTIIDLIRTHPDYKSNLGR